MCLVSVPALALLSACVSSVSTSSTKAEFKKIISDEIRSLTADNNRVVAVRYIEPDDCVKCPLIIFSHGANATYNRYDRYLLPLAQLGYRIAAPNHVDSEAHAERSRYTPAQYQPMRLEDYTLIANHFNADITIAAGHSFGALIAQFAGGAQPPNTQWQAPKMPHAVVALSPPGPFKDLMPKEAWASIKRPHLVVTGTTDIVPRMADTWQVHLASYEATKSGLGFALVYNEMNHYFNGAYGRESDQIEDATLLAMTHLVAASDAFIQLALATKRRSIQAWSAHSTSFVSAESN